jgi:predicted nucleic acid-binding protein
VILVDAGPLIGIMKTDDQHHAACTAALKRISQPLGTVWPVVTEAIHLLSGLPRAQDAIWEMILENTIQLLPLGFADVARIRELMRKYANRPMDLADAALVTVTEREIFASSSPWTAMTFPSIGYSRIRPSSFRKRPLC